MSLGGSPTLSHNASVIANTGYQPPISDSGLREDIGEAVKIMKKHCDDADADRKQRISINERLENIRMRESLQAHEAAGRWAMQFGKKSEEPKQESKSAPRPRMR